MIHLQAATEDQADIIARIIQESFRKQAEILNLDVGHYPNYAGFETTSRVRARLISGDRAVLAYLGDLPVGTISYQVSSDQEKVGYIKRFGILPEYRGRGYGRILMDYAEKGLTALGICRAEVSMVAQFNSLQQYYEQLGYSEHKRGHVPVLPFEIVYLAKTLPSD